jgi:ABC-2 type transport system permease protein
MRQFWEIYRKMIITSTLEMLQYRLGNLFWLLGMVFEPMIYLVMWSALANEKGGSIAGYTAGNLAAYYIAWTLVRQWNIALTPFGFEQRVREGGLTPLLLRPLHPFHYDMTSFIAMRIVGTLYWIPIGVALWWLFSPVYPGGWLTFVIFGLSLVLSFVMRFVLVYALGMVSFWTTRVSAIFNLYFAVETILSGRLVPQALLPEWAQRIANVLPFRWSFGFPIEVIIGKLSLPEMLTGLAIQVGWLAVATVLFVVGWNYGIKRYSAVGA